MKLKKCASLVMAAAIVLGTLSGCGSTGIRQRAARQVPRIRRRKKRTGGKESKEKQSGGNLVVYSAC